MHIASETPRYFHRKAKETVARHMTEQGRTRFHFSNKPVSNPCRPRNDGVSLSNSNILSVLWDGIFDGGPPPVLLCSLRNFESSNILLFFKVCPLLFHLCNCSVSGSYGADGNRHFLPDSRPCFTLVVIVLVSFDFRIA